MVGHWLHHFISYNFEQKNVVNDLENAQRNHFDRISSNTFRNINFIKEFLLIIN